MQLHRHSQQLAYTLKSVIYLTNNSNIIIIKKTTDSFCTGIQVAILLLRFGGLHQFVWRQAYEHQLAHAPAHIAQVHQSDIDNARRART